MQTMLEQEIKEVTLENPPIEISTDEAVVAAQVPVTVPDKPVEDKDAFLKQIIENKTIFFYETIETTRRCSECAEKAVFVQRMKKDASYHMLLCKFHKDKIVQNFVRNFIKKVMPDQRRYIISAAEAKANDNHTKVVPARKR